MSGSSQIVNVKNNACLKRFLLKKKQLMGKWEGSLLKKVFVVAFLVSEEESNFPGSMLVEFIKYHVPAVSIPKQW